MQPAIWFPTTKANTGTDAYTERLVKGLNEQGFKAEITWLPLRAEYAPWSVSAPKAPEWANIVHVNTWLHPRFIPETLPIVATIHHSVHHPDSRSYKGWLRTIYHRHWIAPIERRVLRKASRVISVSQFVASTAKNTLTDVPMQVIYNGVDTALFKASTEPRKPNKPFRLLYVGSWTIRKGIDLLAPIMRELGQDFELYYTGGPGSEKDKQSMPANMFDIGRLQGDHEVVNAMQSADAFLFPSRSEGFSLAVTEAIACGLPVIATNSSSLPETVEDGVTGVLCPKDDVTAFANAARQLAKEGLHANKTGASANKVLSIQQNIAEHIKVYQHISPVAKP
ncbi:glycosyltransferase family 4 protein [Sediminihaliea albiluteola]|uniref:glycosyltransferase family 4 protein n=1 Tax=Sediminihaliea albiluteola TaxID=2758564 RepID=UPI001C70E0CA|nr:glycosyltransferase family 4 protein [Sediminihaliea albiluteola]